MTQDTRTADARRWRLAGLALLALFIGYLAGQVTAPAASAQLEAGRVQLDTTNCRLGETKWYLANVPAGAVVTAVYFDQSPAFQGEPIFVHVTCQ